MKKKIKLFYILHWLKDAGFKAIVVLLIVAFGFYAYAQIDWPAEGPNPVSGVVGMFVGETADSFGISINGYDQANNLCRNVYEGSHICTPAEMTNSYNNMNTESPIDDYGGPAYLWINSSAPGNVFPAINDCKGWTDNGLTPYYGTVWNFSLKAAAIQPCAAQLQFACCK